METIRDVHKKKLLEADGYTGDVRFQEGKTTMTFHLPVGEKITVEKENSYTVVVREPSYYLHVESIKLFKL